MFEGPDVGFIGKALPPACDPYDLRLSNYNLFITDVMCCFEGAWAWSLGLDSEFRVWSMGGLCRLQRAGCCTDSAFTSGI